MSKRWNVEVRPDVFHDVGADRLKVHSSGALLFFTRLGDPDEWAGVQGERLEVAYATGQWLTVSFGEDD